MPDKEKEENISKEPMVDLDTSGPGASVELPETPKEEDKSDEKKIEMIKENIVNQEKGKKLQMFSNSHYSNLERTIRIKFLWKI